MEPKEQLDHKDQWALMVRQALQVRQVLKALQAQQVLKVSLVQQAHRGAQDLQDLKA